MKISTILGAFNKGRSFYIDPNGNDNNNGRSPATAWKTIGKINSYTGFRPNDWILFKRGGTWSGVMLTVPANWLRFGAYGSGAKPILNATSTVNYAIWAQNKTGITLSNLDLRNGISSCAGFSACTLCRAIDCDMSGAGNDCLLFYNGCTQCQVHGGTYKDAAAGGNHCGIEISDGGSGFIIDGALCYNNNEGISINNHPATAMPVNIVIRNCIARNNLRNGFQVGEDMAQGDLNILFESCTAYDNANDNYQINKVGANYPSGITFRGCISYGAIRNNFYICGDNILMERCLSYDGSAPAPKGIKILDAINVTVYNQTIYSAYAGTPPITVDGARSDDITIKNMVIGVGAAITVIEVTAVAIGATLAIDYNLYHVVPDAGKWKWNGAWVNWATWKANSGQDSHSHAPANPLFTDPANKIFTLQSGSPAINAGVDVGLAYLGSAPDCGYQEKA